MRLVLVFFLVLIITCVCTGQTRKDSLIVFVGEKIDVKGVPNPLNEEKRDTMVQGLDTIIRVSRSFIPFYKFEAKYRIVEKIYGTYLSDTIVFIVYDHYGEPAFSRYANALLFVSNIDGELIHERYQYFDVYKTVDGRWASPGDPYRFDRVETKTVRMKPIEFLEPLTYDTTKYVPGSIDKILPGPYWRIESLEADSVLGAYVEDLFIVKKEGILKARGIF
jgi:hypothetical protein